jgi:hypothetical protein
MRGESGIVLGRRLRSAPFHFLRSACSAVKSSTDSFTGLPALSLHSLFLQSILLQSCRLDLPSEANLPSGDGDVDS